MFKKEVELLVLIGFLRLENDSEWGAPNFTQNKPKSNSDFMKLNYQLKIQPIPMPQINFMLLKLEGF